MSLRFVQITDHHLRAGEQLLHGYATTWALRCVLRHIAEHAGPIDFVVSTGDLVESGTDAEYQALLDLLGARPRATAPGPLLITTEGLRDTPLYVLPGNHDSRAAFFRNLFPDASPSDLMNTAFERDGVRFICVDWGPQGKAAASPALLDHLAGALRDRMPAVLLMHHHVVPVGSRWLDVLLADDLARFADLIAGRNILGMFSGHTHATYEGQLAGIPIYGLRSTCFQFVLQDELLRCLLPPHYRIVTIADGALTTEIVEVLL
jgi:hypothetical protein